LGRLIFSYRQTALHLLVAVDTPARRLAAQVRTSCTIGA
jgi:hypothetical protein